MCAVLEVADGADGFRSNYESALNYKTEDALLTCEIQHAEQSAWARIRDFAIDVSVRRF